MPAPNHPNPSQVDTNLFLVHYGATEPNERIPANVIPYDERVNAIMQQRHFLLRAGQIRRKEFMLSDRANWPSLPELARHQMAPQMAPRGVPQQMAYPSQNPTGPPTKRARHAQNPNQPAPMPPSMAPADPFDDEEDIARGDMFDHLTPREVSYSRYQQNHEWMEEILSSPYRMGQIVPADLGLGLTGELASLTEGIFASVGPDALSQPEGKIYTGKLDQGEADKFKDRVSKYIDSTNSELEKMKAEHAKSLEEFRGSSVIRSKERELKGLQEETGAEIWRIEGRVDATEDDAPSSAPSKSKQTLDEIVKDVETALGHTIERKPKIDRVAAGGYQEPAPEPEPEPEVAAPEEESRRPSQPGSQVGELMMDEADMDMGGTAAGLLDEMHTGFSSMSTPNNNFPTPQAQLSAGQSNAATPNPIAPSPAAAAPPQAQAGGDVSMGGTEGGQSRPAEGETAPDQGTGSGDWVVVPKEGNGAAEGGAEPAKTSGAGSSAKATPLTGTPGAVFDQNDFGSLEDLDTAGDALAGYDDNNGNGNGDGMGDGLDLQMDMEDSAFGDAFHGVNSTGTPGGEM